MTAVLAGDKTKWVTFGLCTYEAGAILTGRMPTITRFTSRHRWLQPVLVAVLASHFYSYDETRSQT